MNYDQVEKTVARVNKQAETNKHYYEIIKNQ
jgi:hypothetical protein